MVVYIFKSDVQLIDLGLSCLNYCLKNVHLFSKTILWWRHWVYIRYIMHKYKTWYHTTVYCKWNLKCISKHIKTHNVWCVGNTKIDYEESRISEAHIIQSEGPLMEEIIRYQKEKKMSLCMCFVHWWTKDH